MDPPSSVTETTIADLAQSPSPTEKLLREQKKHIELSSTANPLSRHQISLEKTPDIWSKLWSQISLFSITRGVSVPPATTKDHRITIQLELPAKAAGGHGKPDRDVVVKPLNQVPVDRNSGDNNGSREAYGCYGSRNKGQEENAAGGLLGGLVASYAEPSKGQQELQEPGGAPSETDGDDPFREPEEILGCSPTTFVFPHSNSLIPAAFHDRYLEVIHIFRRNTEEHPRLRDCVQYIDYTLKMCGASHNEVHPSILVFCRPKEFKALYRLLTNKELKYQYALRRRPRVYPWTVRQGLELEEDCKPFFNLYFWRQRIPRKLLAWRQTSVRIHNQSPRSLDPDHGMVDDLTLCGSRIEYKNRNGQSSYSTLGCVIIVDGGFCAVTSGHASQNDLGGKLPDHESDSTGISLYTPVYRTTSHPISKLEPLAGSGPDNLSDIPADHDYVIDDIEYESFEEEEEEDDDDQATSLIASVTADKQGQDILAEPGHHDEVDSDWSLIRLTKLGDLRPNAFISPDALSVVFLSKVAETPPTQNSTVFILTSHKTPRRGTIQPGTSMLGGINGTTLSMVWSVVLDRANELSPGDSGSLVINATTHVIYGHVIGLNPLGEVYISPYIHILGQVQRQFPSSKVSMADPVSLLLAVQQAYRMMDFSSHQAHMTLDRLKELHELATLRREQDSLAAVPDHGYSPPSSAPPHITRSPPSHDKTVTSKGDNLALPGCEGTALIMTVKTPEEQQGNDSERDESSKHLDQHLDSLKLLRKFYREDPDPAPSNPVLPVSWESGTCSRASLSDSNPWRPSQVHQMPHYDPLSIAVPVAIAMAGSIAGPSGPSQGLETEYTTAPSTSTRTRTHFQSSSVFSGDYAASEVSWAPNTVPPHPREHVSFAQQFVVGTGSPPPPPSLWCEFHDLGECPDVFDADDEEGWIRHHRHHLGDDLPNRLLCWFCDDFIFECTKGRRANFESRMRHIAGHIRGDGDTLEQMRPDFFMVQHLYRLGQLSDQVYDNAMQYSELPSSYQLPQEEPAYDSRPSKYGTKSQVQAHDQAKEDRERKHRKDSNRRKKR